MFIVKSLNLMNRVLKAQRKDVEFHLCKVGARVLPWLEHFSSLSEKVRILFIRFLQFLLFHFKLLLYSRNPLLELTYDRVFSIWLVFNQSLQILFQIEQLEAVLVYSRLVLNKDFLFLCFFLKMLLDSELESSEQFAWALTEEACLLWRSWTCSLWLKPVNSRKLVFTDRDVSSFRLLLTWSRNVKTLISISARFIQSVSVFFIFTWEDLCCWRSLSLLSRFELFLQSVYLPSQFLNNFCIPWNVVLNIMNILDCLVLNVFRSIRIL